MITESVSANNEAGWAVQTSFVLAFRARERRNRIVGTVAYAGDWAALSKDFSMDAGACAELFPSAHE